MMVLRNRLSLRLYFIALSFLFITALLLYSCISSCSGWKEADEKSAKNDTVPEDFHKSSEKLAFKKAVNDSVSRSISESMDFLERELESQKTDLQSSEKLEEIRKPKPVEKPKIKPAPVQKIEKPVKKEVIAKKPPEQPIGEIKKEPEKSIEKVPKVTDAPSAATQESPGNTYLLMGHTAFKEKGYRDATRYLKKAIEADPNLFLAHYWLGRSYIERGRHFSAVRALEKALATRSEEYKEIDVEKYLAWEYAEVEQYDKAVALYRRRVEKDPKDLENHFGLAFALKGGGALEEAVQVYRKAIEIDPDISSIHFNLANTLEEMGKRDEAIEEYKTAISIRPDYGKAYFNLGMAFEKEGKWEEALEAFNRCIELGHKKWQAKRRINSILKGME